MKPSCPPVLVYVTRQQFSPEQTRLHIVSQPPVTRLGTIWSDMCTMAPGSVVIWLLAWTVICKICESAPKIVKLSVLCALNTS